MSQYDSFDVPVAGGSLRVGRWAASDPAAPVVVAAHGVTANHRCWALVAARDEVTVVAPDLRGRGRSATLEGPAGMDAHVADLLALADHLGLDRVRLAGHSMGGFVVAAFAARHPERTASVLLVDGGLPLQAPPPGLTPQEVLAAVIGPAAQRLTMTFASTEAYFDYWRDHPALGPAWSDAVEDYLAYDLTGAPPERRSSVSLDAVAEDSADLMDLDTVATRAKGLPAGTVFLRAPAGLMAEPGGLYPPTLMAEHEREFAHLDLREVAGVDHYSILLGAPGAAAVSAALTAPPAG
ncbi:MAG: alpha/beta fold hydrolase [Nocardioidaceae bacterium]